MSYYTIITFSLMVLLFTGCAKQGSVSPESRGPVKVMLTVQRLDNDTGTLSITAEGIGSPQKITCLPMVIDVRAGSEKPQDNLITTDRVFLNPKGQIDWKFRIDTQTTGVEITLESDTGDSRAVVVPITRTPFSATLSGQ